MTSISIIITNILIMQCFLPGLCHFIISTSNIISLGAQLPHPTFGILSLDQAQYLMPATCIREVPVSKFGRDTNNPISYFSSLVPGKARIVNAHFHPRHFQLIIHCLSYNSALRNLWDVDSIDKEPQTQSPPTNKQSPLKAIDNTSVTQRQMPI